jgi:hypothetical protein
MKKIRRIPSWLKTLFVITIVFFAILIVIPYFIVSKEVRYRLEYDRSDAYYAYDSSRKLSNVYGVRLKKDVDRLMNFYDWKLNEANYKYGDISQIIKLPPNTVVYAQKYLRDSSVVYVAFEYFREKRKDSVTWNLYIPNLMLHRNPMDSISANKIE